MVKSLRDKTGAGIMDSKRALVEVDGDEAKAVEVLREKGLASAARRAGRETTEGVIESYIHSGNRVGALVQLSSETDFVARTDEFAQLAKELAMQVAAMNPRFIDRDSVPDDGNLGSRGGRFRGHPHITTSEPSAREVLYFCQFPSSVTIVTK